MTKAEAVAKVRATIDEVLKESPASDRWELLDDIDDHVHELLDTMDDEDEDEDEDEWDWDDDEFEDDDDEDTKEIAEV